MALTETQQANHIINRSNNVLIIVPEKASVDALSSMIALYLALQKPSADTSSPVQLLEEISPSHVPSCIQFLPGSSQVKTSLVQQPEVIMDIIGSVSIINTRHEKLRGGTRLHLSLPPNTSISKDQIETSVRTLPYQAIIVVGATDLEELGENFSRHTDFFYNTPIINIDNRAENEHFGTVNLVDITAGSLAEVAYGLISSRLEKTITSNIATALYAGIIAGTDSFQKPSTTPRSFQVAANLIEYKANRDDTIQHLIKTKPLRLIKLLGIIYARLRHEESSHLFWTALESGDFANTGASEDDIPTAMKELTNNIAGYNIAFLIYEADTPKDLPSSQSQKTAMPNPPHPPKTTEPRHSFQVYLLLGRGLKQKRQLIQQTLAAQKENGALVFTITAPSLEAAESKTHEKIKYILP